MVPDKAFSYFCVTSRSNSFWSDRRSWCFGHCVLWLKLRRSWLWLLWLCPAVVEKARVLQVAGHHERHNNRLHIRNVGNHLYGFLRRLAFGPLFILSMSQGVAAQVLQRAFTREGRFAGRRDALPGNRLVARLAKLKFSANFDQDGARVPSLTLFLQETYSENGMVSKVRTRKRMLKTRTYFRIRGCQRAAHRSKRFSFCFLSAAFQSVALLLIIKGQSSLQIGYFLQFYRAKRCVNSFSTC